MNYLPSSTLLFVLSTTAANVISISAAPEDFVEKGNALMQLSRDEMNPSLYGQAAEFYNEALEADPENTDAMVGMAWVENSNHNFENGENWAKRALEANSEIADAYSLLGDSYVEHGEYADAFENYQRSLDLRPDLSSYSRAAHLVWLTGDREKGMQLMELAISAGGPHTENTAWCKSKLSMMLLHSGKNAEALELAENAAMIVPLNPLVLANLAQIQRVQGDTEQSFANFEKAYRQQPTHESLSNLYDLYLEAGKKKLAETIYQELLTYHRNHHGTDLSLEHPEMGNGDDHGHGHSHVPASAQLAKFWLERDLNLELALAEAKTAFHQYPNIDAADTLALAYFKSGQFAEAAKIIEKALQWSPPIPEIYLHAELINLSIGESEEAKRCFSKAIELNPSFRIPEDTRIQELLDAPSSLAVVMIQ